MTLTGGSGGFWAAGAGFGAEAGVVGAGAAGAVADLGAGADPLFFLDDPFPGPPPVKASISD